ncbi:MAG: type VI secretion system tip protein VgrG [Bacteroidetes bacterium]|nr:type VI secretion system tip protein VgrG [Bacteroidota bacterium]MBK9046781.1 type VI secretion system tip protein VgrG [Bacteroidota bacterium]MBK9423047.1 type VI secretion system tip protein VgrG [Bacteroidota bacterium]
MGTDTITNGSIVGIRVSSEGSPVSDKFRIYSITIEKALNGIPEARITILDGSPDTGKFEASSSNSFVPGKKIVIEAGYDNSYQKLFEGIVVGQEIQINDQVGSALEVICKDPSIKLTIGRKSKGFVQQKDSDAISSVIAASSLSSTIPSTSITFPILIQFQSTDWDFILKRAEANGFVLNVDNGNISAINPDYSGSPVLSLTYGINILNLNLELDARNQLDSVQASSWDYNSQKIISGSSKSSLKGPGNLSSSTLSAVVGPDNYNLCTPAFLKNDELLQWAKSKVIFSEFSKITGSISIPGTSKVSPGTIVSLNGVGDRFSGDHYVSAVSHDIQDGNWLTEISVGIPPDLLSESSGIGSSQLSQLLPPVTGTFSGKVKKIDNDPDGQFRISVAVNIFCDPPAEIWCRVSNFYSSNGCGVFFLPEMEDEVLLSFINDDPRYPVIIGSMYANETLKPFEDFTPSSKNPLKGIVSKSKIALEFDDENTVWTLKTPAKNIIEVSDKDKSIKLTDQHNNTIMMSSSGIAITSDSDVQIKAKGKITLDANQNIEQKSSGGDISLAGLNFKAKANVQCDIDGGAMASFKSNAQMTIKSSIVMIN